MSWPEVSTAKKENRHELILFGNKISDRISKNGLNAGIFDLTTLNYLDIHDTCLSSLPEALGHLENLQTLVLHTNKLTDIPPSIQKLSKLKILDVSQNDLIGVPEEVAGLLNLTTLNVSGNRVENLPTLARCTKLTVLNASNNKLKSFPDVCYDGLGNLSELLLGDNEIDSIPSNISSLANSTTVANLKVSPAYLTELIQVFLELNLKDNPIADKRLLKVIVQCHTKQVLDYVKQHCVRVAQSTNATKAGKKGKKKNRLDSAGSVDKESDDYLHKISVSHFTDDSLKIVVKDDVKEVRPHLTACLILNLEFTEETFKKFIQLQTKLHDTLCEKRNVATIATHDFNKLGVGNLVYTAMPPNELMVMPLNRLQLMSGAKLFAKLQAEADSLRKEKKRNTYSGIHKYLYLLEGKSKYPCLLNGSDTVISFPPITNSETTKMTLDTTALVIEVTSATSLTVCKKIADTLIKEMLQLFGKTLTVQQIKNVDVEGNLKSVYPSRSDLVYDDNMRILVERD